MKQLVFRGLGDVGWEEVPDPAIVSPTDAVIRPLAVARCDLDIPMVMGGLFPGPYAVGHEIVGEVVERGDGVTTLGVGDRVIVPFQVSCGRCDQCRAGLFAACAPMSAPAGAAFGFGPAGGGHGGGLSDRLLVPFADHLLQPAPAGIDPATLAVVPDNYIDGYRAVGPALSERPGVDVLVVAGLATSIGLYAVAIAGALGAGRVRYVDGDTERMAAAEALGAEVEERGAAWPRRFERAPITVDATGDPDGLATVLRSTESYGRCTSVAIYFGDVSVPMLGMYTRGITFHTSRADSRRYLPDVLELIADGRLDPGAVPITRVGWEEAAEAWLSPAIKLVVARS